MQKFTVASRSAAVEAMAGPWQMIDDLCAGTAAMRERGQTYLPKWPKEDQEAYKARLSSAVLFPAFAHTSSVMAAKPFARGLNLDATTVPADVLEWMGDCDLYGTDLQPFAASIMARCLRHGLCGVLVDAPQSGDAVTLADAKAMNARPYATIYDGPNILGWRAKRGYDDDHILQQLRLMECVNEPDGEFGETIVRQVRVLEPGSWRTFRFDEKTQEWFEFERGAMSIDRVPFTFFYGVREDFGIGRPPLLDLAFLNVKHYQSESDQQTILHVARVPILFAAGFSDADTLVVGASSAATSSSPDAKLSYIEHTGAAIEAGRLSIKDIEDQMRQVGAELIVQRQSQVTATEVKSDHEASRSILQKIVEDFEESLGDVIENFGAWVGEEFEPKVTLFKDFGAENGAAVKGDLTLKAVGERILSRETAFGSLQGLDVIPQGVVWEEEKARIDADPPPAPEPVLSRPPKEPAQENA